MERNLTTYRVGNHGNNVTVDAEMERREEEGGVSGVRTLYTVVGVLAFITLVLALANMYVWYRTRRGGAAWTNRRDGQRDGADSGGGEHLKPSRTKTLITL